MICSYNRSVTGSQPKNMFLLLTALKDDLFPERIWDVPFIIRKWCLSSYGKYLGTVCSNEPVILVKLLRMKQLTQYFFILLWTLSKWSSSSNASYSDSTSSILNERETCFASGMERDCLHQSQSVWQKEIFEPQPGNFGWMDRTLFYYAQNSLYN